MVHHRHALANVIGEKAILVTVHVNGGILTAYLPKLFLQESVGTRMEVGKEYEIRGRVIGVCGFRARHFEGERSIHDPYVLAYLGKKGERKPIPGQRYPIAIDSVTERRDFRLLGRKRVLTILRASIISLGLASACASEKNEIVELRVRNLSWPDIGRECYFIGSRPNAGRIQLEAKRIRGNQGDLIRIEEVVRYGIPQFVDDFDAQKPENLKNVRLNFDASQLFMHVDGRKVALHNVQLSAIGLRAMLAATIEDTSRRIVFYFDGECIIPEFLNHRRIISVKAIDSELEISYIAYKAKTFSSLLSLDQPDREASAESIVLVSPPRREGESYHFSIDSAVRERLASQLDRLYDTLGKYACKSQKAKISEVLQNCLMSLIPDWDKVAEHPFDSTQNVDPQKRGPDALYRRRTTNDLFYIEFKWIREGSINSTLGKREIRRYLSKHPMYNGERVMGGYLGVMNWDTRSTDMFFYLRKAEMQAEQSNQ